MKVFQLTTIYLTLLFAFVKHVAYAKKSKAVNKMIKFVLGLPHARRLNDEIIEPNSDGFNYKADLHQRTINQDLVSSDVVSEDGNFISSNHINVESNSPNIRNSNYKKGRNFPIHQESLIPVLFQMPRSHFSQNPFLSPSTINHQDSVTLSNYFHNLAGSSLVSDIQKPNPLPIPGSYLYDNPISNFHSYEILSDVMSPSPFIIPPLISPRFHMPMMMNSLFPANHHNSLGKYS